MRTIGTPVLSRHVRSSSFKSWTAKSRILETDFPKAKEALYPKVELEGSREQHQDALDVSLSTTHRHLR